MESSWKSFSSLLMIFTLIIQQISGQNDTINVTQSIRDGETMVSSNGRFELGFFSPGNSSNRYLGLWYKNLTVMTIVWVANNREAPLANTSGVLRVIEPGVLVLENETRGTIWSSNISSRSVQSPVAQLLDNGNIVIRDANDDTAENFIWQSFDYPTDTYLQGMKFGWNLATGFETYLVSWKSEDDPSPGQYGFHLDPTGVPQIFLKNGEDVKFRIGPWNGLQFSGARPARVDSKYTLSFVMNEEEVSYKEESRDKSVISSVRI